MKKGDIWFMKPVPSAFIGVVCTLLAGLILFPLVSIIFDSFFHLYFFSKPPADKWKDDIILGATVVVWFLIASTSGGFVCSLISDTKEDFSILLFLVFSFILAFLFSEGKIFADKMLLLPVLPYITGACLGGMLAIKHKKRKANTP
jgi:hypothetical protein